MRGRRGFLLVLVMFVMLVVLLMGLAFLGSRAARNKAAVRRLQGERARELALAGIEDARVKFQKDILFPPPGGQDQVLYSYMEEVTDVGGGSVIGRYLVTIDMTYATPPQAVAIIHSQGVLGDIQAPLAERTVMAELDLYDVDRTTGNAPNPNGYRIINWRDEP